MRPLVEDIFRQQAIWIKIYPVLETVLDPYEKNVEVTYLNPFPIRAIVGDLTADQMVWKTPGIKISKAKEIFIEHKWQKLIEMSGKIEINGDLYEGHRENGKMQIRHQAGGGSATAKRYGGYLKLYVYAKAL